MVEEGFLQKLDLSKIPNVANISQTFKNLWWDPTNEYQVPKDYGTTGVLYRSTLIPSVPKSWKEFYDLVKGAASGKTVFVDSMGDVMVFPLKMLGYSLNSVDSKELDEARTILLDVAPHLLALDSDKYGQKMADGEAALTLGWTGPLGQELKDTPDKGYVTPSEGTLFWLDTWVMMADAPASERIVCVARLHPSPRRPGRGVELQLLRDAGRERQAVRQAGAARGPGGLPARGRDRQARAGAGHVGQHPAHRHLGRVQVEDRQADAQVDGEGTSRGGPTHREARERSRPVTGFAPACSPPSSSCRRASGISSCSSCR